MRKTGRTSGYDGASAIRDPASPFGQVDEMISGSDVADLRARIREDAISGVLVPGQRLKLEDLRGRYSASVGSLRETLMQLVSDGFVTAEANRGFCVAPVSLEDLDDITEMRVDLERKAITLSIEHGDDRWEGNLVAAFHMLQKLDPSDPNVQKHRVWWERHNSFHEALVAACPSPWLLRFREVLFDHSHRYRALSHQRSNSPGRIDEHRILMDAALRRDVATTTDLIESHIRKTTETVRQWFSVNT